MVLLNNYRGKNYAAKLTVACGEAGEAEYWTFVLSEIGEILTEDYEERFKKEYLEIILMLKSIVNKIK